MVLRHRALSSLLGFSNRPVILLKPIPGHSLQKIEEKFEQKVAKRTKGRRRGSSRCVTMVLRHRALSSLLGFSNRPVILLKAIPGHSLQKVEEKFEQKVAKGRKGRRSNLRGSFLLFF